MPVANFQQFELQQFRLFQVKQSQILLHQNVKPNLVGDYNMLSIIVLSHVNIGHPEDDHVDRYIV